MRRFPGRLTASVVLGFAAVGVLVTTVSLPRMHNLELEMLEDAAKHLNIHVHFESAAPVRRVPAEGSPVNIHLHFITPPPLAPVAPPKTHIRVNIEKAPAPLRFAPARTAKVTRIVDHSDVEDKNGTITNTTTVTVVTDRTHTPPRPDSPPPKMPAVPGHNVVVNVIEHGSALPTRLPTNGEATKTPSAPKGAIVVNVIDKQKHKPINNNMEAEPSGGLLPPDWAQNMGKNLPPSEPIGSDTANPQVDIYAINFTDETYYFEYCGKRYNEIPPRSVIGQETYGNEVWEIVSADGIVMIQAKVVEYNQRFVIKNALTEATTADFH